MTDVRLIVGPPGTGKTSALAAEAEKAGAEYGGADVVIASLTRTAAAEIAERTDIPDANVGTLHAHAFRALDHPNLAETPEGLRAWAEAHPHLRLTGGRTNLDDVDATQVIDDSGKTQADDLHQAVMNHRARMTPTDQWGDAERDYYATWTDWKRQTDRLDFTDLVETALTDTDQHPLHPRTLLGDEAQDFSTLELALFRKWAAGAEHAIVAADPDQTIYSWRGSDPSAFQRIPDDHVQVLGQSYRVPAAVHQAALAWIRQIADRRDAAYKPRDYPGATAGSPIALEHFDPLVETIAAAAARGETTMVLTTCTYMLAPALRALKDAGIPFHNPLRPQQGAWNPLAGGRRLAAFLRPREDIWGEKARAWTWDDVRAWTEPLAAKDALKRGAKALIESKCHEDQFGQSQAGDEVSLDALCNILDDPGGLRHPAFKLNVDWWESKLRPKTRDRMIYPLQVYRERGGQALVQKPQVIVGTVHSVKGGEADHVILAPDLSKAAMYQGWMAGGPARDHIVRTMYVGLTRARRSVTVLSPSCPERVPVDELLGHHVMEAEAA